MATFVISYDLQRPDQDCAALAAAIKELGRWWHHLDSTWLVVSDRSAVEVRDALRGHLDGGDELLIIDVTGQPRAWHGFSDRGARWLTERYE